MIFCVYCGLLPESSTHVGVSTGLSGDLVSQMMEEVLGQRDQAVAEKESSG